MGGIAGFERFGPIRLNDCILNSAFKTFLEQTVGTVFIPTKKQVELGINGSFPALKANATTA